MRLHLFVALLCILLITPGLATAQIDFDDQLSDEDQALVDQISEPIVMIYLAAKYIVTVIAALILLFAGVTYIISGGEPRKRETAKNIAVGVIIGLIIIWVTPFVIQYMTT